MVKNILPKKIDDFVKNNLIVLIIVGLVLFFITDAPTFIGSQVDFPSDLQSAFSFEKVVGYGLFSAAGESFSCSETPDDVFAHCMFSLFSFSYSLAPLGIHPIAS